jgi:hypothetical protein
LRPLGTRGKVGRHPPSPRDQPRRYGAESPCTRHPRFPTVPTGRLSFLGPSPALKYRATLGLPLRGKDRLNQVENRCRPPPLIAEEFDGRFDEGESIFELGMDPSTMRRPGLKLHRFNVEVPAHFIQMLDCVARAVSDGICPQGRRTISRSAARVRVTRTQREHACSACPAKRRPTSWRTPELDPSKPRVWSGQ